MADDGEATRAHGEARLKAFVPSMGLHYAANRNFDRGPGAHHDVSNLSRYIRRRLILEHDVVASAISAHGLDASAKFVEEVIWRGYFKGWLEHHPTTWGSYREGLQRDLQARACDDQLHIAVEKAEAGLTGLDYFDAWAQELVATGYLHNHARMWFASIWIFTLGLPWRIGADFFYRHLLDGDPASNTLGWRWVAGLHTRGKCYTAQASNISRFTSQRFTPRDDDLAAAVLNIVEDEPDGLPPIETLRSPNLPMPGISTALLITEDDCRIEDFDLADYNIVTIATLSCSHLRSVRRVAQRVTDFETQALADAATRVCAVPGIDYSPVALRADMPADLVTWAARHGVRQIVTPYVPTGPLRDWLNDAEPILAQHGMLLCEWRRDWDHAIWPYATAGFFKIKERIPAILQAVGI